MELAGIFMLPLFTQFGFQKIHILNIKFGIGHHMRLYISILYTRQYKCCSVAPNKTVKNCWQFI